MQLFFDSSEEGEGEGIGLISGTVQRLQARVVPQMGWNDVELRPDPLFQGLDSLVAYYANSFACKPVEEERVIATTRYDEESLVAGVRINRSWGVQFHPEKSSSPGLRLIRNFLEQIS